VGLILIISLGTSFLTAITSNDGAMYSNAASFSDLQPGLTGTNGRI
jgi:hypothetical protein